MIVNSKHSQYHDLLLMHWRFTTLLLTAFELTHTFLSYTVNLPLRIHHHLEDKFCLWFEKCPVLFLSVTLMEGRKAPRFYPQGCFRTKDCTSLKRIFFDLLMIRTSFFESMFLDLLLMISWIRNRDKKLETISGVVAQLYIISANL